MTFFLRVLAAIGSAFGVGLIIFDNVNNKADEFLREDVDAREDDVNGFFSLDKAKFSSSSLFSRRFEL